MRADGNFPASTEDIRAGQEAFLTYGLMEYGSVYGHGAYLGPDFTADYLHRLALELKRAYGGGAAAEESAAPQQSGAKPKTTAEKGVFGEAMADEYMAKNGYKKMNGEPVKVGDKPQGKGIDGVWKNDHPPPEYVISEAKYGTSDLGMTKDGPQMSDKWIDKRLDKAVGKVEADKISDSMLDGNVEKWLLKVDEKGNVTKEVLK